MQHQLVIQILATHTESQGHYSNYIVQLDNMYYILCNFIVISTEILPSKKPNTRQQTLQVLAVAIGSRPKIKVQINMYKVKHVLGLRTDFL
jgi:hypothetical protein